MTTLIDRRLGKTLILAAAAALVAACGAEPVGSYYVAADGAATDGAASGGGTSGGGTSGGGGTSSGGTSSGGASGGGTSGGGTAAEVDPACVDGKFTEVLPSGSEDISDLIAAYKPDDSQAFIEGVLARRYPLGELLVKGAVAKAPQHCVDFFLPQSMRGSASQVLKRMGVIVHECGHFYDLHAWDKKFGSSHYKITDTIAFTCKGAAYQGPGKTFARSLIKKDKWAAANTPCEKVSDKGCDTYAALYLNGDPTDGKFDSGDQGFNMLFEEVVQYVNSLAEAVAFKDQIAGATSARDGILTFLWYMTRYLQMARLEHPADYKVLAEDPCWREAILTVWGRAWLYLAATEGDKKLTVKGDKLLKNAREPELLAEIALLRKAHGCK